RTHQFLWEQFRVLRNELKTQPDDVDMPVLPIVLLLNLGTGNTSVIADFNARKPEGMQPARVCKQLETCRVTRVIASPYFVKALAAHVVGGGAPSLLKKIVTGGAPVFPPDAALFVKAFPHAEVQIIYGSTEAEPISSINAAALAGQESETLTKGLCVGALHPAAEVRIIPVTDGAASYASQQAFDAAALPTGTIGEIVVKGPHVLKEYHDNPEAMLRNKIIVDGDVWHRTGDAGSLDEKRTLYLVGRCSQIIRHGSKILYPFLVEYLLSNVDDVDAGTVVMSGGSIVLCIQTKKPLNQTDVASKLHASNVPFDRILRFNKLPRDPRHRSKYDYAAIEKAAASSQRANN
ncbi:MAG TPA: AMP-binding protein, partial [Chitinophagales bacterium]|nr:AMP-binding protein [Chitinophagales bacterium]